jgi:hypothetical protein
MTGSLNHCSEIVTIFQERAAIEETYAKSLQKLNKKAGKTGQDVYGTFKLAWAGFAQELADQAKLHQQTADLMTKKICEPLIKFRESQAKEHKVKQAPTEKAFQNYLLKQADVVKAQKKFFDKGKEAESSAVAVEAPSVQQNVLTLKR